MWQLIQTRSAINSISLDDKNKRRNTNKIMGEYKMFYSPEINFKNWIKIYYEACMARHFTDEIMSRNKSLFLLSLFVFLPVINSILSEIFL